jgi:hypothetical protein
MQASAEVLVSVENVLRLVEDPQAVLTVRASTVDRATKKIDARLGPKYMDMYSADYGEISSATSSQPTELNGMQLLGRLQAAKRK